MINKKITGGFLQGPIPHRQIFAANKMGRPVLSVFLLITGKRNITKEDSFKISSADCLSMGVHRNSFYNGLKILEKSGIIKTSKHRGRQTLITILPNKFWTLGYEE